MYDADYFNGKKLVDLIYALHLTNKHFNVLLNGPSLI